jgi:hypothetical protein
VAAASQATDPCPTRTDAACREGARCAAGSRSPARAPAPPEPSTAPWPWRCPRTRRHASGRRPGSPAGAGGLGIGSRTTCCPIEGATRVAAKELSPNHCRHHGHDRASGPQHPTRLAIVTPSPVVGVAWLREVVPNCPPGGGLVPGAGSSVWRRLRGQAPGWDRGGHGPRQAWRHQARPSHTAATRRAVTVPRTS